MNPEYKIIAPCIERLDFLPLEKACDVLEVDAPKYSIDCVNWKDRFPYHPITAFSIAHTTKRLYIDFFVRCNYLRAVNYRNNSNVCEDSCVEFFMQIPGVDEYWNFEMNCIGTINASHRKDRAHPIRLTDSEIRRIGIYASCGCSPFKELEGLFMWNLAVSVPFDLVGLLEQFPTKIFGNFYKCASATSMPHYLSWAPIKTEAPNFHCPEYFGLIELE